MHRCKLYQLISISPFKRLPNLLLHCLQKKILFVLYLITFCASPALAVAAQSRPPEDSARFAVQPYVSIEDQKWMENIIGVPKEENTPLDLIKVYSTEKQLPAPQQETMKIGWSISPLFAGYTNSSLAANMPVGVILKLRF